MDKLEQVKFSLENNPNIAIANIYDIDRRNNPNMLLCTDLAQVVNFNVAPVNGFGINRYLAENLQLFMTGLISGLESDKKDNFEQEIIIFKEKEEEKQALLLKMGYLNFYEDFEMGFIQTILNIDKKKYEMSKKVNYIRKITINPFPSKEIADNYKYTPFIGHIKFKLDKL